MTTAFPIRNREEKSLARILAPRESLFWYNISC